MKALEFIFYLGIITAVFRFLWAFFIVLLVLLKGTTRKGIFEAYFLKLIKYFLLVSLVSKFSTNFSQGESITVAMTYIILGGTILFMYMVSKNEKKQTLLSVQKQFGQMFSNISNSYNVKLEWLIISLSVTYYVVSVIYPIILENPLTLWFESSITSIYSTPVIGWMFKFVGFLFLLQLLYKGFNAIRILILGKKHTEASPSQPFANFTSHFENQNNDQEKEYDDFEDVSDDEEQDNEGDTEKD